MIFTDEIKEWLPWVIKIRFVIITFVFAIDYSIHQLTDPGHIGSIRSLGVACILWYIVSLFFLIYNQLSRDYLLQAYLQIFSDIVVITGIVHVTGDLESNYFSLYLVAIILASILLTRGRAFLVAAVSFVFMGAMIELVYLPSMYPELQLKFRALQYLATTSMLTPDLMKALQVKIGASLFGFFAVAYLSSYLAESLRKAGRELRDKSGQVASLQAKNENIIQSMREGLLSTDLEGAITELNPAGAEILGRQFDELRGGPVDVVFRGLADDHFSSPGAALPLTRQEITYLHPRTGPRIIGVSLSPLMVPTIGGVGYVYNFQDLTEEKRREAEYRTKDRMATLGRMAAGIAHEIRNPLASIAGSVKLLQSISELDEDQAKLITIVSRESERLNKLASDFLLYARDQRFEFHRVDVVNLLEETLLMVEHHPLFSPAIHIDRKLPRRPVNMLADADKLRQVFWNICDNSLKAMPEGGTLTAQAEEVGKRVRVVLGDTGIGFTSVQLDKVFEPFQSGFSEGTGLGLALVYQIIRAHQGSIQVDSQPGKGARFVIDLPREALPALPTKAETDQALSDFR
ncbi:MAG: ATP-binding protein [Terriglobia bacterium]|jgi:two-component system sensor histidine kinase PilS (NtrC family)